VKAIERNVQCLFFMLIFQLFFAEFEINHKSNFADVGEMEFFKE
jgi:hypothetical protein